MTEAFSMLACITAASWFFCPIAGALFAPRGRGGAGFVLGFLLGPVGVVIALFLSPAGPTAAQRRKREDRLAKRIREEVRQEMEDARRREE